MKAIEFKARANEGIIEIPEEFKNKLNQEVRVIILSAVLAGDLSRTSQ